MTDNIFAIWWDPKFDHREDAYLLLEKLMAIREDLLNNLGMADPPNPSAGKCFTYVTKTMANLTTFGRKPGIYNGIIIFEIDIMKNSSPLNLKFTFFATVKTKITLLFCWTHSTLSSVQSKSKQNKQPNNK